MGSGVENRNSLFHKREKPWVRGSDWGGCGGDGTAAVVALNKFPGCDRNFVGTASWTLITLEISLHRRHSMIHRQCSIGSFPRNENRIKLHPLKVVAIKD